MSESSSVDKSNDISLSALNQHAETLTEAELSHDIVGQVGKPVSHVSGSNALLVEESIRFKTGSITSHDVTELTDVGEHDILHSLESIFRESLAENTSLSTMDGLVDDIVRIVHSLDGRESIVEVRLLDFLSVTVDIMETLDGVDGDEVWSYTDMGAIFLVQFGKPEMTVAIESVIKLNEWSDAGQKGAWKRA